MLDNLLFKDKLKIFYPPRVIFRGRGSSWNSTTVHAFFYKIILTRNGFPGYTEFSNGTRIGPFEFRLVNFTFIVKNEIVKLNWIGLIVGSKQVHWVVNF